MLQVLLDQLGFHETFILEEMLPILDGILCGAVAQYAPQSFDLRTRIFVSEPMCEGGFLSLGHHLLHTFSRALLQVTGKKVVSFKADLNVTFSIEGLVLVAIYPRGTEAVANTLNVPSAAGMITRVKSVTLDPKRTRMLAKVPEGPYCQVTAQRGWAGSF